MPSFAKKFGENKMKDLTTNEKTSLTQLEKLINANMKSFFEIGLALQKIREEKLYRETHGTFEGYCRDRWEFNRAHAYRLIDSAQVVENVSHGIQKPTNERQARPLARLSSPELQRKAWKKAIETAPEGKVTARYVSKVVSKTLGEEVKKKVSKARKEIDKENLISDEFKEGIRQMLNLIQDAREGKWRATSKEAATREIKSLLDILAIGE